MIKRFLLSFVSAFTVIVSIAQNSCPIIPQPNRIDFSEEYFCFSERLNIEFDNDSLKQAVVYLKANLKKYSNKKIQFKCQSNTPLIYLSTEGKPGIENDGYELTVDKNKIILRSSSLKGMFYGVQSVLQLCLFSPNENGIISIRCCHIEDSPRYQWRGLMLDESRHFFGKEKVKQLLDYMALHKLNVFHWHLTDAPGWRLQIKKYPKLAKVGGRGNDSNPDVKASYYTQREIKQIVRYASKRHIEIIPEIDMPGHATAANRAYPEFSGGGSEKFPEFTFNPGKDEVYQYLTNILKEVKMLFPSQYIHLGGDEVHFGNHQWKDNEDIQQLMKRENLENVKQVEQYFIRRMADSVNVMGKKVIGWDEVTESGLDENTTRVMWWRHDKQHLLNEAIDKGYQVIMCPRIPMYFDFIQDESHHYGRTWGGFCDIEKVYDFPTKDINRDNKLVVGIQACVWTENIQNSNRLDFMTFPRLSAMAEAGWTNEEGKDYTSFTGRLKSMIEIYEKDNIYYYDLFNPGKNPEPIGVSKRK